MSRTPAGWWLILLAALTTGPPARAQAPYQTVTDLLPTDDAHTYNLSPGTSYGSDPALNIGRVANTPLTLYRAHLRFDLGALPPGEEVASAELHWYQTNSGAGGVEVNLHPITSAWSEATLTWSTNPSYGVEYSNQSVGGASGWHLWNLTCLVRDWRAGVLANHGVVIKDDEVAAGAYRPGYGVSREGAANQRPFLRVVTNTSYGASRGGPAGTVESRTVPLTFRLVDPAGLASTATVEYSTTGGATWSPASASPLAGLWGSGLGVLTTLSWNTLTDAVGLGGSTPVQVRVSLASASGSDQVDYAFSVDNAALSPGLAQIPCGADAGLTNRNECEPPGQNATLVLGKERNSPPEWNRGLFRFDLSRIPPATPVNGATFHFFQASGGGAGGLPVDLYRITQAWDEGTVTWATTPTWDPTSFATVSVGDNFNSGYQAFPITALVQGWISGAYPNLGLLIKDGETQAGAWRPSHGHSREHPTAAEQPYLEVDLGQPPPTCVIVAPAGTTESGDVTVSYQAASAVSAPVDIVPRWSTSGGATWWPATPGPGGDGVSALPTSPAGTSHTYVWDSVADLPGPVGSQAVDLEIEISDGLASSTCATSFTVDNSGPVCVPPAVCGDCSGDSIVNIIDALVVAQIDVGLQAPPPAGTGPFNACNVQGAQFPDPGATLDVLDALAIAQHAALLLTVTCC